MVYGCQCGVSGWVDGDVCDSVGEYFYRYLHSRNYLMLFNNLLTSGSAVIYNSRNYLMLFNAAVMNQCDISTTVEII